MSQLPDQIEEATAVSNRIRAALGCGEITEPHTPENVSRARLLRVRAGLCHVLTEIMPGITASAERLAMANNMEGAMIERYGIEQGTANAIVFYQAMIDTERGELTPFGRETLAELRDGFIADLNENGLPEMPAAH